MLERLDGQVVVIGAAQVLLGLVVELLHGGSARSGSRLVGRHDHALDARQVVERLERHDHLDRGAVGVGDDAGVPIEVARVDLGNHQRHVLVHAECAGVVDHHGARVDHGLTHLLGHLGAAAEQRDVDALEALGRHFLDGQLASGHIAAAVERELLARAAGARQSAHLARREVQVMQHFQKLQAHGARGTGDRDHRPRRHLFVPHSNPLLVLRQMRKSDCPFFSFRGTVG